MTVGRPPKFKSEIELSEKIDNYFASITMSVPRTKAPSNPDMECDDDFREPILNDLGEQIIDAIYIQIPSILGLCEYLDLHRTNLLDYEVLDEFRHTIKKAKQRIEKYNAEQLYRKEQVTGIIFNLKNNFDWKDKSEVDNNTRISVVGDVLESIGLTRPNLTNDGSGSN